MDTELKRDALYPGYATVQHRAGDVRATPAGKQVYSGTGWIDCDGRTLLTIDYQVLFEVMGYMFGGSGGSFKLPDLRDKGSQVHPESALPSRPSRALARDLVADTMDRAQLQALGEQQRK